MPTRVRRPSVARKLLITFTLLAFQGYLGYHAVSGQFGITSQQSMIGEIADLEAKSAALQTEIESYKHRNALFAPERLDPDILTERARALLGLAHPDDTLILVGKSDG
ncbi:MAG TPA: septum formation initiator family protein [Devosiaceae bacterium]